MQIFQYIADRLSAGENLALATIVSRSGSAPRAAGSKMVVRQDGASLGTIGGGILEAQVQSLAQKAFAPGQAMLKQFRLTNQDAGRMGQTCGGVVQILVQFLDAARPGALELYRQVAAALDVRQPVWLITALPSGLDVPEPSSQSLLTGEGAIMGDLNHQAVSALTAGVSAGQPEVLSYSAKPYLVEALFAAATVYIFGAGHVSQHLAPLAARVGFHTVVLDDRPEFANRERFPDADEIIVLDSFQRALERLDINADSYLVLVTRGHAHDQTVLRQVLATPAGYIGM
ncbi:MAG TPA: XdhC family protein, partial [Desulfobaccales bacterium]|nr:XdhC family protein [Desulfobaccales bacterium]